MTTFSQVAMFYLYCDYVFSGCYVLLGIVTTFSQVAMLCLLGIVTMFSQVTMFYLVL